MAGDTDIYVYAGHGGRGCFPGDVADVQEDCKGSQP